MRNLSDWDTTAGAEAGADMTIVDPVSGEPIVDDDSGKPWTITLLGQDSAEFQARVKRIRARVLDGARRTGRVRFAADDAEADSVELLVAATKAWSGVRDGDSVLEFSPEKARDLYRRFRWLREQVDAFIGDRANFLGNSRRNSSTSPAKSSD